MKTKAGTWNEQEAPVAPFSVFEGGGDEARETGDGIPRPFRPEGRIHTHYPKELKLHVTLEALRERIPQSELGARYGIPQSLISIWKKAAVEAIQSNIHYKQRKRREALGLMLGPESEEESLPVAPAKTAQHVCHILRAAVRQIERDPAILERLEEQALGD